MKALLLQWDVDPAMGDHSGHGAAMQGMVDDATMTKLKSLKGPEFDTLWLQAMIGHHQAPSRWPRPRSPTVRAPT